MRIIAKKLGAQKLLAINSRPGGGGRGAAEPPGVLYNPGLFAGRFCRPPEAVISQWGGWGAVSLIELSTQNIFGPPGASQTASGRVPLELSTKPSCWASWRPRLWTRTESQRVFAACALLPVRLCLRDQALDETSLDQVLINTSYTYLFNILCSLIHSTYEILYTMYYVYIRYTVHDVLYTLHCILYSTYCLLYFTPINLIVPSAHNQVDSRVCAFHRCKRICAFLYVLLDMCEAYVRLICAQSNSPRLTYCFHCFATSSLQCPRGPPGSQQEAPREPPRTPGESTYQTFCYPGGTAHNAAHMLHIRKQGPGARSQEPAAHNEKEKAHKK